MERHRHAFVKSFIHVGDVSPENCAEVVPIVDRLEVFLTAKSSDGRERIPVEGSADKADKACRARFFPFQESRSFEFQ